MPAVVNVGSAHSRRLLSHAGGGGERKHAAPPRALRRRGVYRTSDKAAFSAVATLVPPALFPSLPAAFLREHRRPQTSSSAAVISGTAIPAAVGSLGGPGTLSPKDT